MNPYLGSAVIAGVCAVLTAVVYASPRLYFLRLCARMLDRTSDPAAVLELAKAALRDESASVSDQSPAPLPPASPPSRVANWLPFLLSARRQR